ncbi:hypothetical protein MKW92_003609 [Papaver armeniacum]|nr:hypothetical protein MKW92_003609 [Papaver armeniacum]
MDLVDINVFCDAKEVIDALQSKDVAVDLAWCAENKYRWKKSKVHHYFSSFCLCCDTI